MVVRSLKSLISSSVTGQWLAIRKLSALQLQVYLMFYSLCYKGSRIKSMREISYQYVGSAINTMYGTKLNKRTVKYVADKLVKLGLLERKTTHFKKLYGNTLLPTKSSYYRLNTAPRPPAPPIL